MLTLKLETLNEIVSVLLFKTADFVMAQPVEPACKRTIKKFHIMRLSFFHDGILREI